ncbi:transposase [Pseudohongiella nitratireducens]|uniref:transposase n=1 Tax=Pseudohongiella nitratireducens TaxID=1768907 RepID=UPI0030EB6DC1|tara:strand:+ start:5490 stop:5849 length:360 start_codon:yes stop_codon:yes gene_type:complete
MARILCEERVVEYSVDFKIKVVQLTDKLDVNATQIAEILGLHPVMVYRWRQEYREGKFIAKPTRTISMTKEQTEPPKSKEERSEIARLRKEVAGLKKENDFLKKLDRYLKDQKHPGSDS